MRYTGVQPRQPLAIGEDGTVQAPTPAPGVPLDLGPPLVPWHAEEPPPPQRAVMPGPIALSPAPGGGPSPDEDSRFRGPPAGEYEPPPPSPQPTERLSKAAGPVASKALYAVASGMGGPRRIPPGENPIALRPERGPAAATLVWRRGHHWRRSRQALIQAQAAHGSKLAQQVGRAPGFAPEKVGGPGGLATGDA